MLSVFGLAFECMLNIRETDAQIDHGILGVQCVGSEEVIWVPKLVFKTHYGQDMLTQGMRIALTGV
jgi:hypothetical protein